MTEEEKIKIYSEKIREYYQSDCKGESGKLYYDAFLEWLCGDEDRELKERLFLEVNVDDLNPTVVLTPDTSKEIIDRSLDNFLKLVVEDVILSAAEFGDFPEEEKGKGIQKERRTEPDYEMPELTKRRALVPIWARVAAVLVPLIVIAGFWAKDYHQSNVVVVEQLSVSADYIAENAQTKELSLDDGTQVTLNSGTKLETLQDKNQRTVKLDGESYFEVKKDASRPFVVKTETLNIRVLGTKFNVEAYTDREYVIVTLAEGSVQLNDNKGGSWTLTPNHQFAYNKTTNEGKIFAVDNCDEALAWINGIVICKDMTTAEIFSYLERKYDLEFTMDSNVKLSQNRRYSAKFGSQDNVSDVLDILLNVVIGDLKYTQEGKTIRIMNK